MTNIITRSTVAFIKQESTESTPVAPTAATDAVPLQNGFDMSPSYEQLTNEELRSSIGISKAQTGAENPTFNMSHYLKHSGTEGTAPAWRLLAKAAFGAEDVEGTEYSTTVGSTVTSLAITSASTNLIRGQSLLIKDPVNGYRIRCVDNFPTANTVSPSFQLPTGMAPATGVALGKAITYYPANTGHPSLTVWNYLGNGGAIQMMAGSRVTQLAINADAGQQVNMDLSLEGLVFYWDPVEITSSTRYIDFTDDDGTFAAAITVGWYKDPHDLAAAATTAMNAANSGETHTVTYSNTTGKYTFVSTGTVLTLKWNTGTNTANTAATKFGFTAAADSSGTAATTGYASTNAITLTAPYTATYDNSDPLIAKNQEVMIGNQTDYLCFDPSSVKFTLGLTRAVQGSICAVSGRVGSTITQREVTCEIVGLVSQYDADKMRRYRDNSDTRFQYSFGTKSGGNWVAGKSGALYMANSTVNGLDISDLDGYASMTITLKGYVNSSGDGEVYLSLT